MPEDQKPMDPHKTVCVCKDKNGKEVGRIAASARNAPDYIQELASHYGEMTVEYVEDATYAMVSQLFSGGRRELPRG
jgi:hypothetical protein